MNDEIAVLKDHIRKARQAKSLAVADAAKSARAALSARRKLREAEGKIDVLIGEKLSLKRKLVDAHSRIAELEEALGPERLRELEEGDPSGFDEYPDGWFVRLLREADLL